MSAEKRKRLSRSRLSRLSLAASGACCVVVSLLQWLQLDWFAALTLIPTWCWLAPAIVLTFCGMDRNRKRATIAVLILWIGFTILFVEEARSLIRLGQWPSAEWKTARRQGRAIRVVSLNCFVSNPKCASEVAEYDPDIVLLQESPTREHLERLTNKLFGANGSYLWGGDTSIIARGTIRTVEADILSHFVHATVELPNGVKTNVICLRLQPPVSRLDWWSPGFWADHQKKRSRHRYEIHAIMESISNVAERANLIVGGDFNAPPSDGAMEPLRERLVDSFELNGRGWGSTGTNDYPMFRVDQVWVSRSIRVDAVVAKRTLHSDHRMVICDLFVANQ